MTRLIAVLGHSDGGASLHPTCAARLRKAQAEARAGDVVLLSGWARRRNGRSEAELMAEAWSGPEVELIIGPDARTTYGNALAALDVALARTADEVVVVTSAWHTRRAAALFRSAFAGTGIDVALAPADGEAGRRARLRELACWLLAPAQSRRLHRRSRRRWGQTPDMS